MMLPIGKQIVMKRIVPKFYSNLLVRWKSTFDRILYPSEEVINALRDEKPILALESTIITHGMPFPTNLDTAFEVEDIVRRNGVIPATIAVINGVIKIGLSSQELEMLSKNKNVVKISRRDLPFAAAKCLSGGTTVSATMLIAHKAGIKCFATGGVGGVHRGAEVTFDISADLRELGRTPVTVFSSGIKSILDIEKSLEYLETEGVPVTVFDKCENYCKDIDFPAFYSSKSGCKVSYSLRSVNEAATLIYNHELLQLQNGIFIAIPVPQSLDSINEAIDSALIEAKEKAIKGKDITPFVLQKISEITKGESLKTNVALIKNNALVASQVVCELNQMKQKSIRVNVTKCKELHEKNSKMKVNEHSVVVIGGSILDTLLCVNQETIRLDSTTVEGTVKRSVGGVARNLADCINRLGHKTFLISCVGDDSDGRVILNHNQNLDTTGIKICSDVPTSTAFLTVDMNGESKLTVCDTRAHKLITKEYIAKFEDLISKASIVVIDANIPLLTMEYILSVCFESGVPVFYEPTDPRIAANIFQIESQCRNCVLYASPNLLELEYMFKALHKRNDNLIRMTTPIEIQQQCKHLAEFVLNHCFQTLLITLGSVGNVVVSKKPLSDCLQLGPSLSFTANGCDRFIHYFPVENIPKTEIVSSSGAGDCFVSGFVSGIIRGKNVNDCIKMGQTAAKISLKSSNTVPIEIESMTNCF